MNSPSSGKRPWRRKQCPRAAAVALAVGFLLPLGCSGQPNPPANDTGGATPKGEKMSFTLQSTAFMGGGPIPAKFTCDGADLSPALAWTDPPAGTKSLCLVVDDPDAPAGLWTHWLLWNLPDTLRSLPEGVDKSTDGPAGSRQGASDFHRPGYGGPCPPPGPAHRYYFKLYALDAPLELAAGASRKELDRALSMRKILGTAELMGRYTRNR